MTYFVIVCVCWGGDEGDTTTLDLHVTSNQQPADGSLYVRKVSKCAKIRNRYIQVPHQAQDINGKVTNSQASCPQRKDCY